LEALNREQGDIWDTGKTESGNSTQVIYQTQPPVCSTAPPRKANEGKDLQSAAKYFWKVKTWTTSTSKTPQTEHESDWSEPASFVTGLIAGNDALPEKSVAGNSPGEETERWTIDAWIKHPSAAENKCIRFRHSYLCTEKYKSAYAFVASVGYHELYINGPKVDDRHLAPPVMN
jgi:alpha-L-rhamnosidase